MPCIILHFWFTSNIRSTCIYLIRLQMHNHLTASNVLIFLLFIRSTTSTANHYPTLKMTHSSADPIYVVLWSIRMKQHRRNGNNTPINMHLIFSWYQISDLRSVCFQEMQILNGKLVKWELWIVNSVQWLKEFWVVDTWQ